MTHAFASRNLNPSGGSRPPRVDGGKPAGFARGMTRIWPRSLIGRSMLVVGAAVALQMLASVAFFQLIDREALREDHARRIAELLVVGGRVDGLGGAGRPVDTGRVMSTRYLDAGVSAVRPAAPTAVDPDAAAIRRYMVYWEPELARRDLALWTRRSRSGEADLVGVMRLDDGRWLTFRSRGFERTWPIAVRLAATTVVGALILLAVIFYVLRQLGRPLRTLTQAARDVGHAPPAQVQVEGTPDLRDLGRAFNDMQLRIAGLIDDQTKAMEAISHDFRTPLARLKLAAEFSEPEDARQLLNDNIDELDGLLDSLGAYLRVQRLASRAQPVDVAQLAQGIAAASQGRVRYEGPSELVAVTHRGPLEEALTRLADNAARHGGGGTLRVAAGHRGIEITLRDQGPGVPPEDLHKLYQPFFRADAARRRETGGFGLGIPTADRLLRRFGGELHIANHPEGGLIVTVRPPPGPSGGRPDCRPRA
jgi:signal transduction histidine kinase